MMVDNINNLCFVSTTLSALGEVSHIPSRGTALLIASSNSDCVYIMRGRPSQLTLPVPEVGLSLTLVMRRFCQLRREMPIAQCWLEREVLFFNLFLVTKLATQRTNCLICFYCGTIKHSTVDNKYQNQYFLVKFFFLQKFSARVLCLASLIYLSVTIQVLSGIILETT